MSTRSSAILKDTLGTIKTVPRTERTKDAAENRIRQATKDPEVLLIGVKAIQKRYKISYNNAKTAIKIATEKALPAESIRVLNKIENNKDVIKKKSHLARAEVKYPNILRNIVTVANMSEIARTYGLRRERIRQIKEELHEFSDLTRESMGKIIDEIEHLAGS